MRKNLGGSIMAREIKKQEIYFIAKYIGEQIARNPKMKKQNFQDW